MDASGASLELAATAQTVNRQIINVGSGVETSMNELVDVIAYMQSLRKK